MKNKTSKRFFCNALLFGSVVAYTLATNPDAAQSNQPFEQRTGANTAICHSTITGTYLATITRFNPDATFRGVITLTQDGNIFVTNSVQSGIANLFNPYSDSQGAWKCISNGEISATTLNFSYPGANGPGQIVRAEYRIIVNPQTQMLQGIITSRFFDLEANPLGTDAQVVNTYTFTAQRVTAD
ncbi:MAG TPA: hypothetical protein DEV81_02750 [Cyanobacteria bacterium UBA11049]|nr:hypothetical protein [Cyanobacteria bacterium UBA11049]